VTIRQATNSDFKARAEQKAARPAASPGHPSPGPGTPGSPTLESPTPRSPPSVRLPNSWTLRGIGLDDRIGYLWDTVLQEVKRA